MWLLMSSPSPAPMLPAGISWTLLLGGPWGDFQGARVLRSLPSLPGASCPEIDRKQTVPSGRQPAVPALEPQQPPPPSLAEGGGGAGTAPRGSPAPHCGGWLHSGCSQALHGDPGCCWGL